MAVIQAIEVAEPPWIQISRRKQEQRKACIPLKWHIPSSWLPRDPPRSEDGLQSVLHVPARILSRQELKITENQSIAALLESISGRKHSAVDVMDAFCHRAAIAHQLTNCLTEILFEQAAERARFLDQYLEEHGTTFGPLHGLPVSLKDTFDVAGSDSSTGLAALCFKPAAKNAPLVDLLLSLGAVIVAKTNVPQTLSSLDSVNNVFGRTMNPINRLCTAGGSSGGEGVMVAMKGCMIGIGSDLGGSIRIPAMCNGVYGFKPSSGRLPYGGQAVLVPEGMARIGVQPVVGPLARSVEDINFVMRELVPRASLWGEDCVFGEWSNDHRVPQGSGPDGDVVIGVLRSNGICYPLPPVEHIVSEVVSSVSNCSGIKIVEVPTPSAWTESQEIMSQLIGIDGAVLMAEYLSSMQEPLVPWIQSRFERTKPSELAEVARWQAHRSELEYEMAQIWSAVDEYGRRTRKLDAIICPVAPHPVPEIDKWGTLSYTNAFNLFDYPAGTIPIRSLAEQDLQLEHKLDDNSVDICDEANGRLWDRRVTDRRVYLGIPLSVQVVVPRLEDKKLGSIMALIDNAVQAFPTVAKL